MTPAENEKFEELLTESAALSSMAESMANNGRSYECAAVFAQLATAKATAAQAIAQKSAADSLQGLLQYKADYGI